MCEGFEREGNALTGGGAKGGSLGREQQEIEGAFRGRVAERGVRLGCHSGRIKNFYQ